jgi:hypothetical protein
VNFRSRWKLITTVRKVRRVARRKDKMVVIENLMVSNMVDYIDNIMVIVDPEIQKLSEDEREEFILRFFQFAGIISAPTDGECQEITEEFYEAVERNIRFERNYLSITLECLSQRASDAAIDEWHYFSVFLATVFMREERSFIKWLGAAFKTMKLSLEDPSLAVLSEEHKSIATEFAIDALRLLSVDRSLVYYHPLRTFEAGNIHQLRGLGSDRSRTH